MNKDKTLDAIHFELYITLRLSSDLFRLLKSTEIPMVGAAFLGIPAAYKFIYLLIYFI